MAKVLVTVTFEYEIDEYYIVDKLDIQDEADKIGNMVRSLKSQLVAQKVTIHEIKAEIV